MLRQLIVMSLFGTSLVFGLMLVGCSNPKDNSSPKASTDNAPSSKNDREHSDDSSNHSHSSNEEHGHKAGAHGGIIVSLGRDSFHVEAIVEKSGTLRIYVLGKEETRVQEIDVQQLVAYVTPEGAADSISLELKPQPQPGDSSGKTSLFVAELPAENRGKALNVTVPSINISGERFRLNFTTNKEQNHEAMPDKVSDDAEKKLYFTAGGIYTTEDIKANGNVTASQKFKGFVASHDLHPKVGEKICPVTLTKANPRCTWIIGGKKYEFCCPPCVDEFVTQAKENPKEIKQPEDYVQKDSKEPTSIQ
jgi:hypothetical protein